MRIPFPLAIVFKSEEDEEVCIIGSLDFCSCIVARMGNGKDSG